MQKFIVELNYNAFITCEVYGENEGEALDKARDMAEEADIRQFVLNGENNAKVIYP